MIWLDYVFATFLRYGTLLELGEKRKDMLEKSCKKFMLFREANELQQWINEKESALTNEEVGSDLEQVEVLQKKFDDFQKVMSSDVLKRFLLQKGKVMTSGLASFPLASVIQSNLSCRIYLIVFSGKKKKIEIIILLLL